MHHSLPSLVRRVALLVCLTLPATAALAADDGSHRLRIAGWVEVSAAGELSGFAAEEPKKLPAAISDGMLAQLAAKGVVPAQRDGQPVALRSWLNAWVVLRPSGGNFDLEVISATLSPRVIKSDLPAMTRASTCWSGSVSAAFTVTPQGRVDGLTMQQDGDVDPDFARSLGKRVTGWRFEPESVAGTPVATPVMMVFGFHGFEGGRPSVPEETWSAPAERAHVTGLPAAWTVGNLGLAWRVSIVTAGGPPDADYLRKHCEKRR